MAEWHLYQTGTLENVSAVYKMECETKEEAWEKYKSGDYELEIVSGDFESDDSELDMEDLEEAVPIA